MAIPRLRREELVLTVVARGGELKSRKGIGTAVVVDVFFSENLSDILEEFQLLLNVELESLRVEVDVLDEPLVLSECR